MILGLFDQHECCRTGRPAHRQRDFDCSLLALARHGKRDVIDLRDDARLPGGPRRLVHLKTYWSIMERRVLCGKSGVDLRERLGSDLLPQPSVSYRDTCALLAVEVLA